MYRFNYNRKFKLITINQKWSHIKSSRILLYLVSVGFSKVVLNSFLHTQSETVTPQVPHDF